MAADDLGDHGRFNDPSLLVMSSLADGPKHGYRHDQGHPAVRGVLLGPGTLYGALARLQHQGLIEALPADDRRRPYRLSDQGPSCWRPGWRASSGWQRPAFAAWPGSSRRPSQGPVVVVVVPALVVVVLPRRCRCRPPLPLPVPLPPQSLRSTTQLPVLVSVVPTFPDSTMTPPTSSNARMATITA